MRKNSGGVNDNYSCLLPNFCVMNLDSFTEKVNAIEACDKAFSDPITQRGNYNSLIEKLHSYAIILAAYNQKLLGYAALYANDVISRTAYLSLIAVHPDWQGQNIGMRLLSTCIDVAKSNGMTSIKLEVMCDNDSAIRFYKKCGFIKSDEDSEKSMYMVKQL